MFRWIAENFRNFLWAFAMAVAVWVAAVTAADPNEARQLSSPIPISIVGQDSALVLNADIPKTARVTLRAPRSVWESINTDPQAVRAILDLSGLDAGEHTLDLQIQIDERPVRLISVSPHSVTLTLEKLETKTLDVDLSVSGQPAVGYQAEETSMDPLQVVIAGPSSQIQEVKRALVAVNLDGSREDIDRVFPVELLDENGQIIQKLSATPDNVRVTIPVSQQGGYRELAVKVTVSGRVASGYRLANISVSPPVVTVYSTDPNAVISLPGVVDTMPLNLNDAKEDISTRLELNLPKNISVVGEQTVLIQAGIAPIQSSLTLSGEKVEVMGLPAGMEAQVSPETVDVIVSGPLPVLDSMTRQDVRVIVDLTGLSIGTHQLAPKVEALIADVLVESVLPATIEVSLKPAVTPTP